MNTGIYKIKNKVNGKFYIGQTGDSFDSRWDKLKKNNHHNKHLQAAYNKYGEDNFEFEVIITCPAETKALNFWEELFLRDHWDKDYCYNQREGGGNRGRHSKETKRKMSEVKLGENNPMYSKKPWNKGKKASKETRKKLSEAHLGQIPHNRKPVKLTLANGQIETFTSATHAAEVLGVARKNLFKAIRRGGWGTNHQTQQRLHNATIEYI